MAFSTIASRQGSATCYQIVLVKNINSTHRVEGIPTQFALDAALKSTTADINTWAKQNAIEFPSTAAH